MIQNAECKNWSDTDQNPTGGTYTCTGLDVRFQDGPLGSGDNKKEPNGCFLEDLLTCSIKRLEFYQGEGDGSGKFKCDTNQAALESCRSALESLESRTKTRTDQGVEGKNETHVEVCTGLADGADPFMHHKGVCGAF